MNLDINNQIARSCDQLGHKGSPKNANFGWVLALYFCPLVLGHPVFYIDSHPILIQEWIVFFQLSCFYTRYCTISNIDNQKTSIDIRWYNDDIFGDNLTTELTSRDLKITSHDHVYFTITNYFQAIFNWYVLFYDLASFIGEFKL